MPVPNPLVKPITLSIKLTKGDLPSVLKRALDVFQEDAEWSLLWVDTAPDGLELVYQMNRKE